MKIYEYNGKHYCEEDISFDDEDYAGDLYDLYCELRKDKKCDECTSYYAICSSTPYSEAEEMIEEEFSDLVIEERSVNQNEQGI